MRVVGIALLAIAAWGQTAPSFDAVSVKDRGSARPMGGAPVGRATIVQLFQPFHYTPGRVSCSLPLRLIVAEAFAVRPWQIHGTSRIEEPEYYEINATMPADTTREDARLMLRTMLVERFGLRFHYGTKPTSLYALVIDKRGTKLQSAAPTARALYYGLESGRMHATSMGMRQLAHILDSAADRPVIDATGAGGTYQFDLKWTPDPEDRVVPAPGILRAIRRLGLRLEKRSIPYQLW